MSKRKERISELLEKCINVKKEFYHKRCIAPDIDSQPSLRNLNEERKEILNKLFSCFHSKENVYKKFIDITYTHTKCTDFLRQCSEEYKECIDEEKQSIEILFNESYVDGVVHDVVKTCHSDNFYDGICH